MIREAIHADEIFSADLDINYKIEDTPLKTRPKGTASKPSPIKLFELTWGEIITTVMA